MLPSPKLVCLGWMILALALGASGLALGSTPPKPAGPLTEERICEILARPIQIEFTGTRLADVPKRLEELLGIPFYLDQKTLEDASIDLNTPITEKLAGVSAGAALSLLCSRLDIDWYPYRGEMVLITTKETMEMALLTRVIDVRDLVPTTDAPGQICDFDRLVALIQSTVQPTSWQETAGGSAAINGFQAPGIVALAVSGTWSLQQDVGRLLASLRALRPPAAAVPPSAAKLQPAELPEAIRPPKRTSSTVPGEERITAALRRRVALQARDMPLGQVVDLLARQLGVPVALDKASDSSPKPLRDVKVTFDRPEVRADVALDLLAPQHDLDWSIQYESVFITGDKPAPQVTKTYDVRDLTARKTKQGKIVYRADELMDTIITVLAMDRWDGSEESGKISPSPDEAALVVRQTWRMHREVAALLEQARAVRAGSFIEVPLLGSRPPTGMAGGRARNFQSRPALTDDPYRSLAVEANNQFACDMLNALRGQGRDNLLFSPSSITPAMGMIYAGARGETAKEIATALHWEMSVVHLHRGMAAILDSLGENRLQPAVETGRTQSPYGTELVVANGLWTQQGYAVEPAYLGLLRDEYRADLASADFQSPATACGQINSWLRRHTEGTIRSGLEPQDLPPKLTRLVLANVVYFKGPWLHAFPPNQTKAGKFHAPGREIEVPMMSQTKRLRYLENDRLQILELPYVDRAFSMVILLPADRPDALAQFETFLTARQLSDWLRALTSREVQVFLPRMAFGQALGLQQPLEKLGVRRLFDRNQADLSGISAEPHLHLGFACHQASIEVDEQGTVAAAATSHRISGLGSPSEEAVFRADRPFLFLIVDRRSGCVLFVGRCANPAAKQAITAPPR